MEKENYVCPPERSWSLDNFIRKWVQNPNKIFGKYIRKGMTVIDLGCGPGFFLESFAEMTGDKGRVVAADLQEEMLATVRKKIKKKNLENRIILHKCGKVNTGINLEADFINAFYIVHEVPDSSKLIKEIYSILPKGGIFFLTEPIVHVSKKVFNNTLKLAESVGFRITDRPRIFASRSAVLVKD